MARTLSDSIIISMIEAATRLAGGRGPLTGGSGSGGAGGTQSTAGGPTGQEPGATTASAAPAEGSASSAGGGAGAASSGGAGGEHDSRSAEQIAHDFRTIYLSIEEVVKVSAEQETKAVGFAPR